MDAEEPGEGQGRRVLGGEDRLVDIRCRVQVRECGEEGACGRLQVQGLVVWTLRRLVGVKEGQRGRVAGSRGRGSAGECRDEGVGGAGGCQ